MRLAHTLGKSLAEIGEMDIEELLLWSAWLEKYDPRDIEFKRIEMLLDIQTACIRSTIVNAGFGWREVFTPMDFMPQPTDAQPDDPEVIEKQMLAWCVNSGGRVVKGKR